MTERRGARGAKGGILVAATLVLGNAAGATPDAGSAAPDGGPAVSRPTSAPPAVAAPPPAEPRRQPVPLPRFTAVPAAGDELAERFDFLCERLEMGKRGLRAWWSTWLGIYGVLTLAQGIPAGLTGQMFSRPADVRSWRNSLATGAITSLVGVTFIAVSFPPSWSGCAPARASLDGTAAGRRRAVARAEKLLAKTAASERFGRSWLSHVGGLLVNAAAGLVLWLAFHQPVDAGVQFGTGMVLSEAQIWTQPTRAIHDLTEYRLRFAGRGATAPAITLPPRATFGFAPFPAGLGFYVIY